jgi:hypothetical protein
LATTTVINKMEESELLWKSFSKNFGWMPKSSCLSYLFELGYGQSRRELKRMKLDGIDRSRKKKTTILSSPCCVCVMDLLAIRCVTRAGDFIIEEYTERGPKQYGVWLAAPSDDKKGVTFFSYSFLFRLSVDIKGKGKED